MVEVNKIKLIIGLAVCVFLFYACSDNGDDESIRHEILEEFNSVELNSVFDIYLQQDTLYAIRIVGSERAIDHISYKVDSGVLTLFDESKVKWLTPRDNRIKIFLSSLAFNSILVNEVCRIQSVNTINSGQLSIIMGAKTKLNEINLDLDVDSFNYWNNHQCGGNLTLKGKAANLALNTFALISVSAASLTTANAFIDTRSLGDCEVFVTDKLQYSIHGQGNIYVHGHPPEIIMIERTSSGQLIQLN